MNQGDPIVIFGAGAGGRRAAAHFARSRAIRYFVDNDPKKHGTRVLGWQVCPPEAILGSPEVSVVVASLYADEIFAQLVRLGVPAHKVELVNPDALVEGGKDPFPVRLAVVALAFLAFVTFGAAWLIR